MSSDSHIVRFGVFEVDLEAGELRKEGFRIRAPEQALQVLALLLGRPGDLVSRSEMREALWPGRSYFDFDRGLNKAVNRLREALGDSAGNPRFIQTVPRRGYRFLAPVQSRSVPVLSPISKRIRLAVLPFENLDAEPEQEFFSDGLTEEMISELGRLSPDRLGIIARTSAMHYKRSGKRIDTIGKELAVDYVLEGSVRVKKNRARISIQLIHVADQTHLWSQSYDRELADIFEVQRDVAQRVADSLVFELLPELRTRVRLVNPDAHEAYLRGRYFWNRGSDTDARTAIGWFERALQYDPKYALAYSGIADCYNRLVWFSAIVPRQGGQEAKAAAAQALAIDSELSEAHASMALVQFWHEWNWPAAEKSFRRATELRPNYAEAHNWYAAYLNVMGRFAEAASEQRIAEELDPLSLTIAMNAADPHYFLRRFEVAIEYFEHVLKRSPNFAPAYYNLSRTLAALGRNEEAIAAGDTAVRLTGHRPASAVQAYAYALAGESEAARKILQELEELRANRYVAPPVLAMIHLGLGEPERALDLLEQGFDEKSYWMIYVKQDPVYDCLRSHPRFIALLRSLGFAATHIRI